jgi:hypothetical protein
MAEHVWRVEASGQLPLGFERASEIPRKGEHSFLGGEVPPEPRSSAGDALPQRCQVIEIRIAELRQLFNAIDPSPFRQRDLDPRAEEFIVDWARDLPMDKPWALVVHLDRPAGRPDEAAALREAIHEYFGQRVVASRRKLRELFRRGRISLVIALAFLTASIAVGDAVAGYLGDGRLGEVIREGFLIGGWVAMWRPLARGVPVRLVAYSRRGPSVATPQHDARQDRVQRGSSC